HTLQSNSIHIQSNNLQSNNLYQHLQRLQLQQFPVVGSPTSRNSPPTYSPLLPRGSTDSPPPSGGATAQNFILQNLSPQHRNSPPPNFQNLHMIKEQDSLDSSDKDLDLEEMSRSSNGGGQEGKQSAFGQNPQISITDAQGQSTLMTSSQDSVELDESGGQEAGTTPDVAPDSPDSDGMETGSPPAPSTPILDDSLPMMGLFSTGRPTTNHVSRPNSLQQRHRRYHT
ncbi:unnamed protein product, partial [Owenia fusiformis]